MNNEVNTFSPLVWSVFLHLFTSFRKVFLRIFHSFRVYSYIFSTRFECIRISFPLVASVELVVFNQTDVETDLNETAQILTNIESEIKKVKTLISSVVLQLFHSFGV
jgi:hypothetical protein